MLADSPGTVIQVGNSAREASSTIAAKRRWHLIACQDLSHAASIVRDFVGGTLVAVGRSDSWTPEELLRLARVAAERRTGINLGIVQGRGEETLWAAAARFPDHPTTAAPGARQILYDATDSAVRGAHLLDAKALAPSSKEMQKLLATPAELIFINGHGNGLDVGLPGVSLCRHGLFDPAETFSVFPCYFGERCFRNENIPTPADRVGARRIVATICWGLYLRGGYFDPASSVSDAFLVHAGVETLVTSVRVAMFRATDLSLLYYLSNGGLPLGRVADEVNRYRLRSGLEADLICLGDPESALSRSVEDVAPECSDRVIKVLLPRFENDTDIRIQLPKDRGRERHGFLLLDHGRQEDIEGVFDLANTAFATIPGRRPRGERTTLELELVDHLVLSEGDRQRLIFDLGALYTLIENARALHADCREATVAHERWTTTAEFLSAFPLTGVAPGSVLARAYVREVQDELVSRMGAFDAAMIELYRALVPVGGVNHTRHLWLDNSAFQREHRRARVCAYCGHYIDDTVFRLAGFHAAERSASHCQMCGPVCDGDPELSPTIDGPSQLEPGSSVTFGVSIRNPYPIELDAHFVAVLEGYNKAQSLLGKDKSVRIAPMGRTAVSSRVRLPRYWPPGVCFAGTAVAVGAKITYQRRPITVRAETRGRRPSDGQSRPRPPPTTPS